MERLIFEGSKKQCANLKKLVTGYIPFGHHNDYPELIKNDFSIIDETFDSKIEILKKIESMGIPVLPKENKIAHKLAKQAIEQWSDELVNADIFFHNGLQYYIEQAILSAISEFKQ